MEPLRWQAYEYEYRPKSPDWYWTIGIIAVGISVASAMLGNMLFAILVILSGFVLALFGTRHPELGSFELNRRGIVVDKRIYPYDSLEAFWVEDREGPRDVLILKSKKMLMPFITVPIENGVSPQEVRDYLLYYIDEEHLQEPITQKIAEYLGL